MTDWLGANSQSKPPRKSYEVERVTCPVCGKLSRKGVLEQGLRRFNYKHTQFKDGVFNTTYCYVPIAKGGTA